MPMTAKQSAEVSAAEPCDTKLDLIRSITDNTETPFYLYTNKAETSVPNVYESRCSISCW